MFEVNRYITFKVVSGFMVVMTRGRHLRYYPPIYFFNYQIEKKCKKVETSANHGLRIEDILAHLFGSAHCTLRGQQVPIPENQ